MDSEHKDETNEEISQSSEPDSNDDVNQLKRVAKEFWAWVLIQKIPLHQWIQALASVALLVVTIGQLVVALSGSSQTDKLIEAANKNAGSADSFARSAWAINWQISQSVEKLNEQAGQLKGNVGQTGRLASATEKANSNVVAADRPWLGGEFDIKDFDLNKEPAFTLTFTNSGKRPARVDFAVMAASWYATFPFNPEAEYAKVGTEPSTSILVPGARTRLNAIGQTVTRDQLNRAEGTYPLRTFFLFGKVDYRDLETNETHFTHICIRYMPKYKTASDNGFRDCVEYNDAR